MCFIGAQEQISYRVNGLKRSMALSVIQIFSHTNICKSMEYYPQIFHRFTNISNFCCSSSFFESKFDSHPKLKLHRTPISIAVVKVAWIADLA